MSEQTNDAAERSAHVTRGEAEDARMISRVSCVREWREDGKLVACAEGVALLRDELARSREEALREAAAACIFRARRHNSRARLEEATDCANDILALIGGRP